MRLEVDVWAAMTKSPSKNLEDLYAAAFEKITESGPGAYTTAMQVFSWLLCLQEPLSPTAFMTVLTMADPDNSKEPPLTLSEVLDVCFNLVTLDSELNVLRFAHFCPEVSGGRCRFFPPPATTVWLQWAVLTSVHNAPPQILVPLSTTKKPRINMLCFILQNIPDSQI